MAAIVSHGMLRLTWLWAVDSGLWAFLGDVLAIQKT